MGLIGGIFKFTLRWTFYLLVLATLLILLPGIPPYVKFTVFERPTISYAEPPLDTVLHSAKHIHENTLKQPEAFQIHNGELYMSIATGEIIKMQQNGQLAFVTKIGNNCEGPWQATRCGRILGFRIDEAGKYLYAADVYYGIWRVDLKTDGKKALITPRQSIEGRRPNLFNSIALDGNNGDFYWTDSTSEFTLEDGLYSMFADPAGRLFHYNAATNTSKVLLDNLWFANGVALAPNKEFVIVAETFNARVWKVYVNGPKKGKSELFVHSLPGLPDNIQPLPDNSGVLIGLYTMFDKRVPVLTHTLAPLPHVRKLLARLMKLVEIPIQYLNQQFPHYAFEMALHKIGHFSMASGTLPPKTGIARVDWNGNIVTIWSFDDQSVGFISDAVIFGNKLYLGSPMNQFLGEHDAIESLKKAFDKVNIQPPKKTASTVTVEIPKDKPKAKIVEKTEKQDQKPSTMKPTPKPVEQKKEAPNKEETNTEQPKPKKEEAKPVKKESAPNVVPQNKKEIPVKEEIVVDSKKPEQKPIKVITKEGPKEIPNHLP